MNIHLFQIRLWEVYKEGEIMDPAVITLCVLAVAAFLFVTELIPLAVTAMAACTALGILGVLPSKQVYAGLSNSTVVLFGGMFVIGAAMFKTGLAEAIGIAVVKKAGTNQVPLMAAIMLVTIVLSSVSSNTGTVACLMPVIKPASCRLLSVSARQLKFLHRKNSCLWQLLPT